MRNILKSSVFWTKGGVYKSKCSAKIVIAKFYYCTIIIGFAVARKTYVNVQICQY